MLTARRTALAAVLLVSSPALYAGGSRVGDVYQAVGLVPDNVDLAIAVNDASDLRRSAFGVGATGFVQSLAGFSETAEAWAGLSSQLGYDETETFDRLLGDRVVFASREGEKPTWIVISEVSRETEQRLRERLKPAPRQFVGGLPLLAVENGRFEVVIASGKKSSTVALAPANAGGLLDEVGPVLAKGGPATPLAASDPMTRAHKLNADPDVLAFVRQSQNPGVWAVGVGRRDADAMRMSFLAKTNNAQAGNGDAKSWSLSTFEKIAQNAYAVIVEWDGLPSEFRLLPRMNLGPMLQIAKGTEIEKQLGGRTLAALLKSDAGPFDAAIAMQTSDVSTTATLGDRHVASVLRQIGGENVETMDFGGAAPEAVRVVDLTGIVGPLQVLGWKQGPDLAWNYTSSKPEADAEQTSGWWTIGLGKSAVTQVSAALNEPDAPAKRGQWLSVGMVRPAALLAALGERKTPLPKVIEPLRWLSLVEWRTVRTPDGLVQGDGLARLEKPEAPELRAR